MFDVQIHSIQNKMYYSYIENFKPLILQYLIMPKKYINVKEIYVKVPFKQCDIQFIVKRRQKDTPSNKSQIQFFSQPISLIVNQNIQIVYSLRLINDLGLYLIAISSNRVVNIGSINLCLSDNFTDKKQYVKGIIQQKGFIIYSITDHAPPNPSHMKNYKLQTFSQHDINASSNISEIKNKQQDQVNLEESQVQNYVNQQTEFQQSAKEQQKKNSSPINHLKFKENLPYQIFKNAKSIESIQRSSLADNFEPQSQKNSDLKSFMIELLTHKLKNAQYKKILLQNQIFRMQQKNRINNALQNHWKR